MKSKDTPFKRILDWCIVLCILGFTVGQLVSHYRFGNQCIEYLSFSKARNQSIDAIYNFSETTNALSADMCMYCVSGDEKFLDDYVSILNGSTLRNSITILEWTDSGVDFAGTVEKEALQIIDMELHFLKLAAVVNEIPEYQMDEKIRNHILTAEEMALSPELLTERLNSLVFGDEYRNARTHCGIVMKAYANGLINQFNQIQDAYSDLIQTKTNMQQFMLVLSGLMILIVVILLYRQMMTINKMLVNEQQYKGALITDAIGVFEVNLTQDCIETILTEKENKLTNELRKLKLTVPCPFSEFLGKAVAAVPPADAVVFERFSAAYFINQYNNDNRFITRESWYTATDERHLYLRNTILLSKRPDSDNIYALIVFRDITSEKLEYEKQHQLVEISQRSGQQYLEALRTDSIGICEVNISCDRIEHIISDTRDHAIARFFEERGIVLPGKISHCVESMLPLLDVNRGEDVLSSNTDELIQLYKRGVRNQIDEYWLNLPDGSRKYLKNTMLLRKEEGSGDLVGIVIVRDFTEEQKEIEQRQLDLLQQKANNEAKVKFFSRMSHDIRTPLNGVIGMIDLVRHHMDEPDRIRDYVDKIDQSSKHLLSLVNDVLDMSVIESGKLELVKKPVNLQTIMDECCVILNSQLFLRDISLEVDAQKLKTPVVLTDSLAIKKILMNILGNAVKFTSDGGRIIFKSEYTYSFDGTKLNMKYVISDTGIGMSDDFKKKLFEPFTQEREGARTNYLGTGLGMSIVKQYVDALSGTISVESEKDRGTTFTVELPFEIDNSGKHVLNEGETNKINVSGLNVLLVDDNNLNIEIVQMLLEDQGANVTTASNGREAVDIFTASEEGHFNAIIMDIMMPIMDGIEATKAIRSMGMTRRDAESVPVIALTANAFTTDIQKTTEAGMTAHLSKPIVPNTLMETLTRCCRGI